MTLFLKSNGIGQPLTRVSSPLSPRHFAEFWRPYRAEKVPEGLFFNHILLTIKGTAVTPTPLITEEHRESHCQDHQTATTRAPTPPIKGRDRNPAG